jgi:hypothetical protein
MARGWDSKAVESQIQAVEASEETSDAQRFTPDQNDLLRKKDCLLLSRSRVMHDIEATQNIRYRKLLTDALAHLDRELLEFA